MHIIIDNYGVKLEVENEMFRISHGENLRLLSPLKVGSINIYKPCLLTTPAIELAAKHQVPLIIYDGIGRPQACTWSHRYGTIADVRVQQALFCSQPQAVAWAAKIIGLKLDAQGQNIKWLSDRVPVQKVVLQAAVNEIVQIKLCLSQATSLQDVRTGEAQASRIYWDAVAIALQKHVDVPGRQKKGATDPFNSCLNYLYGILYGHVEASLLMAGLDPYMGILHINRYARPALAYDHIEPFRPWADRVVATLFMQGFMESNNFTPIPQRSGYSLTGAGKRILINTFLSFLQQRSYLQGRRIKNADHLHYLSSALVAELKKHNKQ